MLCQRAVARLAGRHFLTSSGQAHQAVLLQIPVIASDSLVSLARARVATNLPRSSARKGESRMRWVTVVFGSLFILFGAALCFGGVTLVRLGGSSYYVIVGIGLITSGIQLLRQRASGVWLYALVVSGTLIWSLAESGLSMWGLLPRLATFIGLGAAFAAALAWTRPQLAGVGLRWSRPMVVAAPVAAAFLLLAGTAIPDLKAGSPGYANLGAVGTSGTEGVVAAADLSPTEADGDWPHWGRTTGGLRYSPLTQITRENVKNLEVAWVYHTGA